MTNISYLQDSSGKIKSEYILPLVLYNLEKHYHFSGNGVWNDIEQDNDISINNSLNHVSEDREELNHKP